ncbi:transporter substrate-binding domain-containing protein [Pseudomonas putida]|uniref:transporter substrate-binding domain-containing protein n=1 Tax=Pseudomonas putida TaxID=303 RepID=UPI001E570B51|nr:transporter substrate-binding domain-containing protein [Pseudomonas putida]
MWSLAWGSLAANAATESLPLDGRAHMVPLNHLDSVADKAWLQKNKTITFGTSFAGAPPLEIRTLKGEYGGITADYLELIADALGVEIRVQRYVDEAAAEAALLNGEVDMLGPAGLKDASTESFIESSSYWVDPSVIVTRQKTLPPLSTPQRVLHLSTVASSYELAALHKAYPNATITNYPSSLEAIAAVKFELVDGFLGSALDAAYVINANFFSGLYLSPIEEISSTTRFRFRRADQSLQRAVNLVLSSVNQEKQAGIIQRWTGTSITNSPLSELNLTPAERRWISENSPVKIGLVTDYPPISFHDRNYSYRGIAADIFEYISEITGLHFTIVECSSGKEVRTKLVNGEVDIVLNLAGTRSDSEIVYTRAFLSTPRVLISRASDTSITEISDLAGRRVAFDTSNLEFVDYLRHQYPDIIQVTSDGIYTSLHLLNTKQVDAIIGNFATAKYALGKEQKNELRIVNVVDGKYSHFALGTRPENKTLYSIIDAAVASLNPEQLRALASRWGGDVAIDKTELFAARSVYVRWIVSSVLLLAAAIAWILYLRRLINQRVIAEKALRDQMKFMETLINSLPHPMYVRDQSARLLTCNQRYLAETGQSSSDVAGTLLTDYSFIPPEYAKVFQSRYLHVMATGEQYSEDMKLYLPGGRSITAFHWIVPFQDDDGVIKGVIGGWVDVTEREALLLKLIEAKHEADNASQAKTKFVATISHEIRTPMNAVVGMLELAMIKARQGVLDRLAIEVAYDSSKNLVGIIGNTLDIIRVESGHLTLAPERVALKELIISTARVFHGLARQKSLDIDVKVDTVAECEVYIDPLRFKQILSNLLSNAIKFTAQGGVTIEASTHRWSTSQLALSVCVRDTGVGIKAEDIPKLFTPFSQVGVDSASLSAGSGLGLNISKALCSIMGGSLNLRSVFGQGTEVEVTLNVEIAPPEVRDAVSILEMPMSRELKILVVDDHPANRLLLTQQLIYLGHQVADEVDGVSGFRAWNTGGFDVVFTDCNMPILNGYDLAKKIRHVEKTSNKAPCLILGFTANAQAREVEMCIAAGMDDCLFKPVSLDDLAKRLQHLATPFDARGPENDFSQDQTSFDITNLTQLASHDAGLMNKLLHDIVSESEEDLRHILRLFALDDHIGLYDLAHRVKGVARIIMAKRVITACDQLQVACSKPDSTEFAKVVDELYQSVETLLSDLNDLLQASTDS